MPRSPESTGPRRPRRRPSRRRAPSAEALDRRELLAVTPISLADPALFGRPTTGNGQSWSTRFALDASGDRVAFESDADNLVAGDADGRRDVFVRDLRAGQTILVSRDPAGLLPEGHAYEAAISADGRFVVFSHSEGPRGSFSTVRVYRKDLLTGAVDLVSADAAGNPEPGRSATVSGDGRLVAFTSESTRLVPGGVDERPDVFVKDMLTGAVVLVSPEGGGIRPLDWNDHASISADGRFVAFMSMPNPWDDGQARYTDEVYRRDLRTGELVPVSVNPPGHDPDQPRGGINPAISADGRFVAFEGNAAGLAPGSTMNARNVLVKDLLTGSLVAADTSAAGVLGSASADGPSISADGRYVAFRSAAWDLVPGDRGVWQDIFRKDLHTGAVEMASRSASGAQATEWSFSASISGDGRRVAFEAWDWSLVEGDANHTGDVLVKDLADGSIVAAGAALPSRTPNHESRFAGAGGPGGRFVAFVSDASNLVPGDTNDSADVFVRDLLLGTTTRVNVDAAGRESRGQVVDAALSADGRYVAFSSRARDLVPGDTGPSFAVYRKDLLTGEVVIASSDAAGVASDNFSWMASISGDGRYIAFESSASNLAGPNYGYGQVYLKDMQTGAIVRLSTTPDGYPGWGSSSWPQVSRDGRFVTFTSGAADLVPGDTNGDSDIFLYDVGTGALSRVSTDPAGGQLSGSSWGGRPSPDGRSLVFSTVADVLAPGDVRAIGGDFRKDLLTGEVVRLDVLGPEHMWGLSRVYSDDGRYAAFTSDLDGLVPGDDDGRLDLFFKDLRTGHLARVPIRRDGGRGTLEVVAISPDAGHVILRGTADDLVEGDRNGLADLFRVAVDPAPVDVLLEAGPIESGRPAGEVVGRLAAVDLGIEDEHTFELVDGPGDDDNGRFAIDGDRLILRESPDAALRPAYTIRVRATDRAGRPVERSFTLRVVPAPEEPAPDAPADPPPAPGPVAPPEAPVSPAGEAPDPGPAAPTPGPSASPPDDADPSAPEPATPTPARPGPASACLGRRAARLGALAGRLAARRPALAGRLAARAEALSRRVGRLDALAARLAGWRVRPPLSRPGPPTPRA